MRRLHAVLNLSLVAVASVATAACNERPPEFGVSVFSADTVPVAFTVSVSGTLLMGLRSEHFQMRPDSSLMMSTPAEIIVQRGDGSAIISSLSRRWIVVQPLGVHPDSSDTTAVDGLAVKVTRTGVERRVGLTREKP